MAICNPAFARSMTESRCPERATVEVAEGRLVGRLHAGRPTNRDGRGWMQVFCKREVPLPAAQDAVVIPT
jgi:hypothetical protein